MRVRRDASSTLNSPRPVALTMAAWRAIRRLQVHLFARGRGVMAHRRSVVPLRDRRGDWFFVLAFSFFAFSSFFSDALAGLGVHFSPDSDSVWVRANYW